MNPVSFKADPGWKNMRGTRTCPNYRPMIKMASSCSKWFFSWSIYQNRIRKLDFGGKPKVFFTILCTSWNINSWLLGHNLWNITRLSAIICLKIPIFTMINLLLAYLENSKKGLTKVAFNWKARGYWPKSHRYLIGLNFRGIFPVVFGCSFLDSAKSYGFLA